MKECDRCGKKMGPEVSTRDDRTFSISLDNIGTLVFDLCYKCDNELYHEKESAIDAIENRWYHELIKLEKIKKSK